MENPLPTYVKSLALSAWLALWASSTLADSSSDVNFRVWSILWAICMPETNDISSMSQTYSIQSWDTFSGIASRMWINYSDFILYLKEFNPNIDVNAVIRIWDEFTILSDNVSQVEIDRYRYALQQRQLIDEIQRLSDNWDYETLREYIDFDITPALPVNLWVRRAYQTTANMYSQGYRTSSRSALPELESEAVCKHVLSQTLARFIWYNPIGIAELVKNIMLREDTPAWIIPYILETEWEYTRRNDLDLREYFNKNFSWSRNAITDSREADYSSGLLRQLSYLRTPESVGCFIPTLYHWTSYAETVLRESRWRDMNSHIFACNWFSYSDSFWLNTYWFSEWIRWNFTPVLTAMMRDLWVIGRYQSASDTSIIAWLKEIHEFIYIEVEISEGSWVKLNFDSNLQITNLSQININQISWYRIGWNILTDGFQITPNWDDRLIEQRLTPDWIIYASHYFNTFHPTSILTAPNELLDAQAEWILGRYVQNIEILSFFDITREEIAAWSDVRREYYNGISQKLFWRNFSVLEVWEKSRVERVYAAHSLWLQILWYHSFNGTDWNPWATNINAWIPFLNIFTDEDISNIESLYASYIAEKRQEYLSQIASICAEDNQVYLPVFYFKYFPGETTTSLWNTLITYVHSRSPELGLAMREMLPTQRLPLIREIFGTQVAAGNIASGSHLIIDAQDTIDLITQSTWEEFIWEDYISRLSPADRDILLAMSNNTQVSQAMAYYMIKEWYVPDTWYHFEDWSYWDILENFMSRLKRKDLKRYYAWLDEKWLLESNQNFIAWIDESIESWVTNIDWLDALILELWIDITDWNIHDILVFMMDNLDKIPATWPNSWWDFQMRFTNLLSSEYAFARWPSNNNLDIATNLIINPSPEVFMQLDKHQERFPDQYAKDMILIESIRDELWQDSPDWRVVYELLTELMNLNDTNNRYFIWKIISISLSQSLHRENITHICEQLGRVWESCSSLSESELDSVYTYSMLTMNKGPNVALSVVTENYLWRVFESIHELYPEIPVPTIEIRQDVWITTKPILNYFEFRRRMSGSYGVEWLDDVDGYIELYAKFAEWNEDVTHLIAVMRNFLESDEESSQKHYSLLFNPNLRDILERTNTNTFIYPTKDEISPNVWNEWKSNIQIARSRFFAYIDDTEIEGAVSESEQKPIDFLAPFGLTLVFSQISWAMSAAVISKSFNAFWVISKQAVKVSWKVMISIIMWWYRRFKKDLEIKREAKRYRKLKRRKKKEHIKYLKSIVLTNDETNKYKKWDYVDGEYIISPDEWIFERKWEEWVIISNSGESVFAQRAYDKLEWKNIKLERNWNITLQDETITATRNTVKDILVLRNPINIAAE